MRKCKYCGYRMPEDYGDNCFYCGALCPPRPPAAKFFLSLLESGGYLAFFFAVQITLTFIASMIISISVWAQYAFKSGASYDADKLNELLTARLGEVIHYVLILSGLLTLFLLWLFMRIRKRRLTSEIEVHRVTPTVIVTTLIFGLAAQFAVSLGISFVMQFLKNGEEIMEEFSANDELMYGGNKIVEFISIALLTPILEETVFRGLIHNTLKKAMPTGAAVILSSLIFGVAHGNSVSFVYATLLGVLLTTLYERYDSILVPMTLHFAFNGGSYLLQVIGDGDTVLFYSLLAVSTAMALIFGVVLYENVSGPHEALRIVARDTSPTRTASLCGDDFREDEPHAEPAAAEN